MPVLLCAFLLTHNDVVTLYSEGTLLPEPSIADWEVLLRRPELFAVAGSRVVGPRAEVVGRLARGLGVAPAALPVVRDLIRRLKTLPDHVWRTTRLSPPTLAVRQAVEGARSPESLLFHDLPLALGVAPFPAESDGAPPTDDFFDRLNAALQELADRMPRTLAESRDALLGACGLPASEAGWAQFRVEAAELAPRVGNPQLAPLLRRATDAADEAAALESVLAYVGGRPPRTWTDHDLTRYGEQVAALGELYRRERAVWLPHATLTPTQAARSQAIAAALRDYLTHHVDDDPAVIAAALHLLQQDAAGSPNKEQRP
jgi:hypothetical protein